jgi:hypothetical protein
MHPSTGHCGGLGTHPVDVGALLGSSPDIGMDGRGGALLLAEMIKTQKIDQAPLHAESAKYRGYIVLLAADPPDPRFLAARYSRAQDV